MLKIRRPLGRLIFNMGIAIPGKTVFLIETAPRTLSWYQDHLSYIGISHDEDEIIIFIMWISKLVRWQLYIEMTPVSHISSLYCCPFPICHAHFTWHDSPVFPHQYPCKWDNFDSMVCTCAWQPFPEPTGHEICHAIWRFACWKLHSIWKCSQPQFHNKITCIQINLTIMSAFYYRF